ncbi:MAG: alpha-amylase family protein [Armatimonadota bacterium]
MKYYTHEDALLHPRWVTSGAILISLVILSLFAGGAPSSATPFSNGGFENGTYAPWTTDGAGYVIWTLSTASPWAGAQCALASGGATASYEAKLNWIGVDLSPNTAYTLALSARNTGSNWGSYGTSLNGSYFKAMVLEATAAGSWGGTGVRDNLALIEGPLPEWTRFTSTFTTSPTTVRGYLLVKGHLATSSNTIAFDDVSLTPPNNNINYAKQAINGTPIHLEGKIVGRSLWGDRFYIQEPDRSCGIGVMSTAAVSAGQAVTVDGTRSTLHGEAYITSATVSVTATQASPIQMSISSRSLFVDVRTTGLLVEMWGYPASGLLSDSLGSYFLLNDGGDQKVKVYVGTTGVVAPATNKFVGVIGISGMNDTTPVLLLASSADLILGLDQRAPEDPPEWVWAAKGVARVALTLSAVTSAITDGADVVEVPVQDNTYSFYPTTVGTAGGANASGVLLQQIVAYAHGLGVKVVGSIPACKDNSILTANPTWRQRPTDSTTWLTTPVDQTTGCLVSPYKDYLTNEVKELALTIGLDGVTLQGYSNTQTFCYCTFCKAKYLADTGLSMPASANFSDSNFRRYLSWHDQQIIDHMTALRALVRAANSNFGIMAWSTNAGEYPQYIASPGIAPARLNLLFDCAMQKSWYDESNFGLSVAPEFGLRYMGALTRRRPWISEADYTSHSTDKTPGIVASSMPATEIQFRMLSAIAAGSTFAFSNTEKQYLRSSLFTMARARSPWMYRAQTMKYAALVMSESTRQFCAKTDPTYVKTCFGYFRALLEQHIPVDILTDADLEAGLASGYKVLILPNTACMSSVAVAAVRSFVVSGGGLVATGSTSLYDEQGQARSNFALSDVFKASTSGAAIDLVTRSNIGATVYGRNSETLQKQLSPYGNITTFIGKALPVTLLTGGTTMCTVCNNTSCGTLYPSYITSVYSGGARVAYFPAAFDYAYFDYSYPYEGVLLRDAVNWTSNSTPQVTIVGPKSLQVTYFTQNSGKRLVVHLLNAANSRGGHAHPGNDVPLRDEVVPMQNIEVWFEGVSPTSATLQPENTPLVLDHQGGRTRVVITELQQHSMVVADIP